MVVSELFNLGTRNVLNLIRIPSFERHFHTQTCCYAARKGYRAKKEKAKVKKEVVKKAFVPHNVLKANLALQTRKSRKFDDSMKRDPIDNVYVHRYFKWKVFPFTEAVLAHRETHHPDMYNKPNADVQVVIELNMQAEKKTRFVDNFTRIAPMPYKFDHGEERSILVFTKDEGVKKEIEEAGARLVGGAELIKGIQNGNISLQDFQFVIAHPSILPELAILRGLLKRKFPNPTNGTLTADLHESVQKFLHGISYTATKDEHEKDFGEIKTVIGTLDMNEKHLEANFASLVEDVHKMKPKRSGAFITRCLVLSPPSREKFKVDHKLYTKEDEHLDEKKEQDEDEEEKVRAAG